MLILNECSFTGKVICIQENGNGVLVFLQQMVAGKYDTAIAAYIVAKLKESFMRLDLHEGDWIHIVGAQMYEKDHIVRLRVSTPSQLPRKLVLNSVLLTGQIIKKEEDGKALSLSINQNVGGKQPTVFNIFIPGKVREQIDESNLNVNDDVVVNGGTMYTKDGIIKIRISSPEQLQKPLKDFCLGEEEARDKFI